MTNAECWKLSGPNNHCKRCPHRGGKGCIRLKSLDDDAAENLAVAILEQAGKDYRLYRLMAQRFPNDKETLKLFEKVKAFFLSDYFNSMTKLNGKAILEQLEKEPITNERLSEYGDADE